MALLAVELKESTRVLHAEAGRSKFMKYFFKGEISMKLYGKFLISYYHVYTALESALDNHKDNAQLSLVYFPKELSRKSSLEQDLEFYNGPEWRGMLTPITPAQQAYISTIERCSASSPELLIAHAYVRYMADLSGGQILSRRLQKYNGIPEGKGVAFYHFELIEQPEVFKDMFRKRLNQVEISDDQRQEIIQETIMAFHRNIDIFQEFDSELEGLPMTRLEQLENLEELEKEKARLAAEAKAAKDVANLDTPKSGFLTSLNPANLWNSLVGA